VVNDKERAMLNGKRSTLPLDSIDVSILLHASKDWL
jgi:hypothetical protein